jgi:hypothetical protein
MAVAVPWVMESLFLRMYGIVPKIPALSSQIEIFARIFSDLRPQQVAS